MTKAFRRIALSTLVLAVLFAGLSLGQGPLTNALNLMLRSNSNGALLVYGVAAGAQGPLTNLGNMQLRAYSPGALAVTVAGGAITPDTISCPNGTALLPCFTGATLNSGIYFSSTSTLVSANGAMVATFAPGTMTFEGTLLPAASASYNLGSGAARWASLNVNNVAANGDVTNSVTALATTSTDGYSATNTTNATVGIPVQIAPRSRWRGSGWDTDDVVTRSVAFFVENLPVSGTTVSGIWRLGFIDPVSAAVSYPFKVYSSGAQEGIEQTAPSAGAANTGRLFYQDNGGGKTQACIQFEAGAAQCFATEP